MRHGDLRTVDKKKIKIEIGGAMLEDEISHVAASEVPMVKLKRVELGRPACSPPSNVP